MLTYEQHSGRLSLDGHTLTVSAYSGHGGGLNNPELEASPQVGPIPAGRYRIGAEFVHPKAGPICMRLLPEKGTDTHGRDGFMIHGDNSRGDRSASEGCIIVARPVRVLIAEAVAAGDNELEVKA